MISLIPLNFVIEHLNFSSKTTKVLQMMKEDAWILFALIFVRVTAASAQNYLKFATYTDSNCNTPNGAFYVLYTETCISDNGYTSCTDMLGLWIKGECLEADPMVGLPDNYATQYIYPSTDATCSMSSVILKGPYIAAHAAELDVCFWGISSYIYSMTGCGADNSVTFKYYINPTDCASDTSVKALQMPNATCEYNAMEGRDFKAYCPLPAPPVAAPIASPLSETMNGPGTNNVPLSAPSAPVAAPISTPILNQTPIKKSDAPSTVVTSVALLGTIMGLTLVY